MDMLRNIAAGSTAASNPLLRSLLGPNASEAEYKALAQEAESVWKMMDDLADNDPEAYQSFVRDAAKAAREEVERARDPHVEGLAPALVLETQAQEAGNGADSGAGAAATLSRVVASGQSVTRVHIWAANDASGVGPPLVDGQPLSPQQASWSGLTIPIAEYKAATTRPGPLPIHHFHVACHVSGVRMCVSGQPPGFLAAFLEAISQFVEATYRLELSRTLRTLQVHRDAVSKEELEALERRQQEHLQAGAQLGSDTPESSLPKGLLDELRTLGTASNRQTPQQPGSGMAAGKPSAGKKALIEELD